VIAACALWACGGQGTHGDDQGQPVENASIVADFFGDSHLELMTPGPQGFSLARVRDCL
jgi:hypothetical protein